MQNRYLIGALSGPVSCRSGRSAHMSAMGSTTAFRHSGDPHARSSLRLAECCADGRRPRRPRPKSSDQALEPALPSGPPAGSLRVRRGRLAGATEAARRLAHGADPRSDRPFRRASSTSPDRRHGPADAATLRALFRRLFDHYAAALRQPSCRGPGYRAPALMKETLARISGRSGRSGSRARSRLRHRADGGAARALTTMEGVDLSAAMLRRAELRAIYAPIAWRRPISPCSPRRPAPSTSSWPPMCSSISATWKP